jgi:hypothetical protein
VGRKAIASLSAQKICHSIFFSWKANFKITKPKLLVRRRTFHSRSPKTGALRCPFIERCRAPGFARRKRNARGSPVNTLRFVEGDVEGFRGRARRLYDNSQSRTPCPPPPPPPPCANTAVGASARVLARTRPTNKPFINLISNLSGCSLASLNEKG